ncbi:glycosyltransferase [Pedobacter rhodius]|uniref:Glycosyltransferase n=1 Tax=Pedobacter rhodius TaxID=3004098 RepID=A0ABT4L1R0_9SPHI|nr:glycosyltransferase [Pedobacter sp. SJ11]MCZ4224372.1 glycosyltransferase [Pedobacter sp. SJ11]
MALVENPILTICIPTYNRANKVYELVLDLLKFEGNEIQIVVLDNISNDDTEQRLSTINDLRFHYVKNSENIGGPLNHLKVLTLGNGLFSLLCLDKDFINFKSLKQFLEKLLSDKEIVFGHCELNLVRSSVDKLYDKGYMSIKNMAYRSQHPSGMFYRTSILKNLTILPKIFDERLKFGFYPDILNGEMATRGKSMLFKSPLVFTESKTECAKTPSFTYDENDVFFAPRQRIFEFDIYSKYIFELHLSKKLSTKLIKVNYLRRLMAATIEYRSILKDNEVCQHYGVISRKVTIGEILTNANRFTDHFHENTKKVRFLDKLYITSIGRLIVFIKLFL